jgi:hypothetical protein
VLVLAAPAGEGEHLIAELRSRKDLRLVRACGAEQARRIVERQVPALAVATPDAPVEWVDAVVAVLRHHGPGTPVLALREAGSEQPTEWRDQGVGVLRCPLVPLTLSRSVDVLLELSGGKRSGG